MSVDEFVSKKATNKLEQQTKVGLIFTRVKNVVILEPNSSAWMEYIWLLNTTLNILKKKCQQGLRMALKSPV